MKNLTLSIAIILLMNLNLFAQTSVDPPTGYLPGQLGHINALAVDTNFNVWVAFRYAGLGKFNRYIWTMFDSLNTPLPKRNILSVACNRAGVWVGTDSGLYNFNGTTWSWHNTGNSNLPNDTVPQLYSSGSNDLFIISNPGFIYFNGSTFTQYKTSNSGLVDDTVQCILKSATGMWWIGTKHGLSSYDGSTWKSYTISNVFICNDDDILSLDEDKNDSLFVGTNGGGLYIGSGNTFNTLNSFRINAFHLPETIYNQFRLSDGNILVTDAYYSNTCIVSTNPLNVVSKIYTSFSFVFPFNLDTPTYLYAIDRVNRIYKLQQSTFNMTYTDSIDVPLYNDSVNMQNDPVFPSSYNFLDINEVKCPMADNNTYFWNAASQEDIADYVVPKSDCGDKTAVFASALWIGGLDEGGNLHMAAQTYRQQGSDFWDGPLDTLSAALDATTKARFDTVWKVNKETINEFIIQYNLGNVTNHTYEVPAEILNWPAQGSGRYSNSMAPFVDHNGDGIYNPYDGDYPQMKGDQMLWWVMNDNYAAHTETSGTPLGVEVRSEAYAYECQNIADSDQALNYTTFYSDSIINRSVYDYHDVYIGIWVDVDLGYAFDDYVGCRTDGNYGFAYNGENFDPGTFGYGANPPMLSVVLLNDTMTHFQYYNNDFTTIGNPMTASNYYNYLHSLWIDSTHVTEGGNGHGGTQPVNFMFPGIPYDTGWSEINAGDVPGDRRFLMSLGPLTLNSKQSKKLDYAIVFSWDKTQPNSDTTSVAQNDRDVRKITKWFQQQDFPCSYTLGIHEPVKNSITADIYPNPASGYFNVRVPSNYGQMKMDLIDITGRLVKQQIISPSIQNRISTDKIAAGVYFVKISDSKSFEVSKLVIE